MEDPKHTQNLKWETNGKRYIFKGLHKNPMMPGIKLSRPCLGHFWWQWSHLFPKTVGNINNSEQETFWILEDPKRELARSSEKSALEVPTIQVYKFSYLLASPSHAATYVFWAQPLPQSTLDGLVLLCCVLVLQSRRKIKVTFPVFFTSASLQLLGIHTLSRF